MYRLVVLVLCYHALSHPVTDEPSNRSVRHLIECCPCPGRDSDGGQGMVVSGQELRASGVDDCPCRARGVDSDGAASLFFPSAVRADGSLMRPIDAKEDSKNLLEPEVALATSMLDTLREVTEEEYQDALARDAARNAAETEPVPEESASNVVIIVNPKDSDDNDDFVSDATHIQASRCIHSLEGISLGKMRSSAKPFNFLPETLMFPQLKRPSILHRNILNEDNNLAASNVAESVVDTNGNSQKFKPRTPVFKLNNPLKSILKNDNDDLGLEKSNNLFGFKVPFTPEFKSQTNLKNNDLATAPSSVRQQAERVDNKTIQLFRHSKLPLNLRNLLKLRDVELIPKSIHNKPIISKPKLDLSKFAIPTLLNNNKKEGSFRESSDKDIIVIDNSNLKSNAKTNSQLNRNTSVDCDSKVSEDELENVDNTDTLFSPSQVQPVIEEVRETVESVENLTENKPDCNSLESKESANIKNNQFEETWDEAKESDIELEPKHSTPLTEKRNESRDSQKFKVEEFLQNQDLDEDQDSDVDSSNNILALVPFEVQEREIHNIPDRRQNTESCEIDDDPSRISDEVAPQELETNESNSPINKISPLQETMATLRENVFQQLENVKGPTGKLSSGLFEKKDNIGVERDPEQTSFNDGQNQQSIDDLLTTKSTNFPEVDIIQSEGEKTGAISMNELLNMSNKLLDLNSNNKIDEHKTKQNTQDTKTAQDAISVVKDSSNDRNFNPEENNACLTNFENRNKGVETVPKSEGIQNILAKEMDTGASESVLTTLPSILDSLNSNLKLRTPLLDDFVLQPVTDPLNLLNKPLNVLNLNTNLPTLDDIRERLANIFNTNDRSAENYSDSLEIDSTNDFPLETMSPQASTKNSQKELPSLKNLENFDIFRNKPSITSSSKSLLNRPKLNLNTYRARVPVPNSLNFKPVKMEPKRGKLGGLDTPLLNLGSDGTSARYAKPRKLSGNSLDSFPTLEELRNNFKSSSKIFLSRPVDPHLNIFTDNLRTNDPKDIAENIGMNAQKTVKGIQQKMKSTLKKTKLQSPLGDPFAKPKDLLDDVNDKLKAIHYDLNDRFSSIRENILDTSTFKTLVDQPRKGVNKNVMTNLRKNKAKPSRLQTAPSTISIQELDPNEQNDKQRNVILGSNPGKHHYNKDWIKPHKTQTASESAPTPVRLESPKSADPSLSYLQRTSLKQNPTMTQLFNERKQLPIFYEFNRRPTNYKNLKSSVNGKGTTSFNQRPPNKVTISFETTTAKPISSSQPVKVPKISTFRSEDYNPTFSSSNQLKEIDVFHNERDSTRAPPDKFKPLRTFAPLSSSYDEEHNDKTDNSSDEKSLMTNANTKPSVFRETPNLVFKPNNFNLNNKKTTDIFARKALDDKQLDWPKMANKSIISKLREAVSARKSGDVNKRVEDAETEQSEMLRSPSENTDISLDEPLKENVSYRCRMVCTKEIR